DVLSFPVASGPKVGTAGDIAVSAEIAAQNGRLLGHSAADEVKVLVLHGILHLAGYDHVGDGGRMARKEQQLRKTLGLPIALIERNIPIRRRQATPKSGLSRRTKAAKSHR